MPWKYFNGKTNICPNASKGCSASCLVFAGRGKFGTVKAARSRRTELFLNHRDIFFNMLLGELFQAQARAMYEGKKICVRLNVLSDIPWENFKVYDGKNIFEKFPNVQFYDYTKTVKRMETNIQNYHLTFSRSEDNDQKCDVVSSMGKNIAVVFNKLPKTYKGKKVVDGDITDLRFLDPKNVVVGLIAKGGAKKDESNFVVKV